MLSYFLNEKYATICIYWNDNCCHENRNRDSSASNLTKIPSKEDKLHPELGRLSRCSSTTGSFRKKWKFNSSFSRMKRGSCKCKNNSIFNLDDCEPKEVSSVIKYLRLRKVFCDNCIFAKFHEGKIIQIYNKGIQISVPNIFKISLDIDLTTCFTSICITELSVRKLVVTCLILELI